MAVTPKAYTSALALVPPRHLWPALQEIRCFHDKGFVRWPPHINLLYPFIEDRGNSFAEAADMISNALTSHQAFTVHMNTVNHFKHSKYCTAWVKPEPKESLKNLQKVLENIFPICSDLSSDESRGIAQFEPHLSLGQWNSKNFITTIPWEPIQFQADSVVLLSRGGFDEPFVMRYVVSFGGERPPVLNLPYIATINSTIASDVVWYFAFGANMCPHKLGKSRGIQAKESMPAKLQGWKMSFTHRGGFGNVTLTGNAHDVVHGVLHSLNAADYGRLTNMEHEYLPIEVEVKPCDSSTHTLVKAVAFVTPDRFRIREGLNPTSRYLKLLKNGAAYWKLDKEYVEWLDGIQPVDERGDAYYTSVFDGKTIDPLPKMRIGSIPRRNRAKKR